MQQGDPNTPDTTIRLQPQQQIPASVVNCYGLAGKIIISDVAWPELEPFRIGSSGEWQGDDLPILLEFGPLLGKADRNVEGWVAEQDRMVSCWDVENGCRVAITDIGEFFVSATGDQITALSIDPTASAAEIMMTLFGPPMILAFAAQDVWLMHAGAVELNGGALLFLGRSGAGKSTLARELSRQGFAERRLCDDMFPVRETQNGVSCMPAYLQLKLGPKQQLTDPDFQLPIVVIGMIEPMDNEQDNFEMLGLEKMQAMHELANNTMGMPLFGTEVRKRHLVFSARCIGSVPVWKVLYPHREESIECLGAVLPTMNSLKDAFA